MPNVLGENVGETEGVDLSPEQVLIEVVAPSASAASQALRSYTHRNKPAIATVGGFALPIVISDLATIL